MTEPPSHTPRFERLLSEADEAAQRDDFETVATKYRECLTLAPDDPDCLLGLAIALIRVERIDEALGPLNAALKTQWDVAVLLRLARLFVDHVLWSMAEQLLTRIIAAVPTHTEALFLYAEFLAASGQSDRAKLVCKEILQRSPQALPVLSLYLGMSDYNDGVADIDAALVAVGDDPRRKTQILQMAALHAEFSYRKAHGLPKKWSVGVADLNPRFAKRELANYRNAAIQWSERAPKDRNPWLHRAIASFATDDVGDAETSFAKVREHPHQEDVSSLPTFDPNFYTALDSMTLSEVVDGLPELRLITQPLQPAGPVFFMSCDLNYLAKYGRPLLRSIDENARNADVHIHLMNARDEELPEAARWLDGLAGTQVAISSETVPISEGESPRAYYVSIRYVRFLQYLAAYGKTMCLMDVDCIMNRDLREAIGRLPAFDVAVRVQPWALEPWSRFAGGLMIASSSAAAFRYVKLVAAFIRSYHRQNLLRWAIDQLALCLSYRFLSEIGASPELSPLSDEIMGLADSESSCLLFQSGRRKSRTLRYATQDLPESGISEPNYVRALRRFSD